MNVVKRKSNSKLVKYKNIRNFNIWAFMCHKNKTDEVLKELHRRNLMKDKQNKEKIADKLVLKSHKRIYLEYISAICRLYVW